MALASSPIITLPRIVHQIWFGGPVPERYRSYQQTYEQLTQRGWEYRLWNDSNALAMLAEHFPAYVEPWQELDSPVKKADCFRYLLMHHFGGLYVDVDSYARRDIETFIRTNIIVREDRTKEPWPVSPYLQIPQGEVDIIVGLESGTWHHFYNAYGIALRKINNAVLFSRPNLNFWRDLVELMFEQSHLRVLDSFGVHAFSFYIYDWMFGNWRTFVRNGVVSWPRLLVVPPEYFNYALPLNDPRQIIVHNFDSNWRK